MFAGFCRIVAVWAMVGASSAAVAQVIPPSELPGRERERFTTYPVTPFQPGAQIAGLPSAKPPPGTSDIIAPDPGIPSNVNAASAGGGLRLGWLNAVYLDLYAVKAVEGPRDDWRFRFILTSRY